MPRRGRVRRWAKSGGAVSAALIALLWIASECWSAIWVGPGGDSMVIINGGVVRAATGINSIPGTRPMTNGGWSVGPSVPNMLGNGLFWQSMDSNWLLQVPLWIPFAAMSVIT